ncbi:MAG: CDP-alcohol phosphatidyltransferase family protein [Clostridia bacterium]|nr:CDP-alcohol phosphatidyltransferase family protein [Clostridia bacterium]
MIPNILTTCRLVLVPFFAYLVLGAKSLPTAAFVFVLSGITDVVDGYIARHFNMVTNFGKVYDPFVDKLMQITAVVCLAIAEIIPVWIIVVVLVKELAMIVIGGVLYLKKIVVYSHWYGKAATVVFYTIVFVMILWRGITPEWTAALLTVLIVTMLAAACAYLVDIIKNYDKKRVK